MSAADAERIAPVTYLFGARQATKSDHVNPGQQEATRPARAPVPVPVPAQMPMGVSPTEADAGAVETSAVEPSAVETSAVEKSPSAEKTTGSFDRVSNVSMYALARRGMSSREMRDYLLGREFESSVVAEEIERLEGVALLDDHALAETLIRTLQARKGLGRSALVAELRRRNIDQVAIESALSVLDDDDELDRATVIAVKRAGQLHSLDATTAKRRLGDFLMRRGYSGSVVSKAVQQALAPSGPTFR
jgi:regulatory protein